jgi:hypothetical protein
VEGNMRGPKSWRGRRGRGVRSMADASTDDESADETVSRSVASSLGMSSMDVDSRRGDDMERPLVGEY